MANPGRRKNLDVKFAYTGIRVKDVDASLRFYTTVPGMKEVDRFTQPTTKERS